MKKTISTTIAKAIVIAVSMSVFAGYESMAQDAATGNVVSAQQVAKDYESLKARLNTFMDKVKQSKKSDLPALYDEAKAIKAEIQAASLTDEQMTELKDTFNAIIELLKKLN